MVINKSLIELISIRGRVALFLLIAEKSINKIKKGKEQEYIERALIECWNWQGVESIGGDDIYKYLENEADTGLAVYGWEVRDKEMERAAWNVLTIAISYVVAKAYIKEGMDKYLPQAIEGVDESKIDQLISYAIETGEINEKNISTYFECVLKKAPFDSCDPYGKPLSRDIATKL